jgi:hypothetical protein
MMEVPVGAIAPQQLAEKDQSTAYLENKLDK